MKANRVERVVGAQQGRLEHVVGPDGPALVLHAQPRVAQQHEQVGRVAAEGVARQHLVRLRVRVRVTVTVTVTVRVRVRVRDRVRARARVTVRVP